MALPHPTKQQDKIGDPVVKKAIAENLGFLGRHGEAIRWYKEVLLSRPADADVMGKMVQSMLWSGDYQDAREYVERLYRQDPDNLGNQVDLAVIYMHTGKYDQAQPIIGKLLEKGGLDIAEREQLAANALDSGNNALLLQLIGPGKDHSGKISEMRLLLARRLRADGRHALSLPLYAASLADNENIDPKLLIEMSESASWADRPDIATRWLDMAAAFTKARGGGGLSASASPAALPTDYRMTAEEWDSMLEPLKGYPDVYPIMAGFKTLYAKRGVVAKVNTVL